MFGTLIEVNMKTIIALLGCLASLSTALSQQSVEMLGRIHFPSLAFGSDTTGGSDCWGYTAPDATEYALMGVNAGIAVVKASTMEVITVVPGPTTGDFPYKHRDIKTYRNYAYAVAEMTGTNQGMMIMDMRYLPDSVHYVRSFFAGTNIRSHNFSIDTASAHAYICRQNYSGFTIVSLADPENPVEVGSVTTTEIHDVFGRNDTVWVAEGNRHTFSMYDVANKTSPVLILRHTIPNGGYVHNIWPTDDGRYAITTEETALKTVKIWDVSNPANVTLVGEYLGPNGLAHNVHVKGNELYISHYESGITAVDISNPANPVETARFDTFPRGESANFRGCWGAFPFTDNGYFYTSDIEGYLTVLRFMPTGVSSSASEKPESFSLEQNYPNPFNPSTNIRFHLTEPGYVSLRVYDLLGREIETVVDEALAAGTYLRTFNGDQLPSGLLFMRLESNGKKQTRLMTFLK